MNQKIFIMATTKSFALGMRRGAVLCFSRLSGSTVCQSTHCHALQQRRQSTVKKKRAGARALF